MSKASNLAGFVTSISPPSNLNVGVVTASSFVGDVTGTATGLSGAPNLNVGVVTATSFSGSGANLTGIVTSVNPVGQTTTSQSPTTTIDLSLGSVIYFTHNTDTTVAFANTATTQELTFIRQKDNNNTPRDIIWPTSVRWNGLPYVSNLSIRPTLINTGRDNSVQTFSLVTRNGGTTWYGWEESSFLGEGQFLLAWGIGSNGRLGQNNTTEYSSPVQIPGATWSSISGGDSHSLATKTDGTLWSWGDGSSGELGQNNRIRYSSPVQIPGTTWSSISGGGSFSLATKTDGTLWAWGLNNSGRLGQNDTTLYSSPRQIPGTTWSSISAGTQHSLATKTDGTLWSWGYNQGPFSAGILGQNTTTDRSSPVQIPGTTWSSISAGDNFSSATKTDNTLWAWGENSLGQLGQNINTDYSSPVQIPGTTWSSISAGDQHLLAKKTDNTLWAWGYNNRGQLGQNDTTNYLSPVQIPGTTWSSISSGGEHSLATKTDNTNTLWAWGLGSNGRLGQNATTSTSSPTQIPGASWSSISASTQRSLAIG